MTSGWHPHHTFCVWLPRSRPLCFIWVGTRVQVLPEQLCLHRPPGGGWPPAQPWRPLALGQPSRGQCFLLGASLTRLRRVSTPPTCYPSPTPVAMVITAQLFSSKKEILSWSPFIFFFKFRVGRGYKQSWNSCDMLTLKSSFEKPDTSLWNYVYTCSDWRALWKLAL